MSVGLAGHDHPCIQGKAVSITVTWEGAQKEIPVTADRMEAVDGRHKARPTVDISFFFDFSFSF